MKFSDMSSQSTIKMEKGYYFPQEVADLIKVKVAIHNKNGKGLLLDEDFWGDSILNGRNPQ